MEGKREYFGERYRVREIERERERAIALLE